MKNLAISRFLLAFFFSISIIFNAFNPSNSIAQLDKETSEIVELPNAGIYSLGSYSFKTEFYPSGDLRFSFNVVPFKNAVLSFKTYLIDLENFSTHFPAIAYFKYRFFDETKTTPAFAAGFTTHSFASQYPNYLPYYDFAPGVFLLTSKAFENSLGIWDLHLGYNYSLHIEKTKGAMLLYFGLSQQLLKYFRANLEISRILDKGFSDSNLLNFSIDVSIPTNFKIGFVFRDLIGVLSTKNNLKKYLTIEYKLR